MRFSVQPDKTAKPALSLKAREAVAEARRLMDGGFKPHIVDEEGEVRELYYLERAVEGDDVARRT